MQPGNLNGQSNLQSPGVTVGGRRFGLPWIIGAVVVALLVLTCGCCGTVSLAAALNGGSKAVATVTVTRPAHTGQVQATQTPHAVATTTTKPLSTATISAGQGRIHAAILGGTEQDFTDAWGDAEWSQSVQRRYQALIGDQLVIVNAALTQDSSDPRFWSLIVSPANSGVTWDASTANSVAKALIPGDARYLHDKNVSDFGLEHVYVSSSLANSFPVSQFTDADTGAAVTPGTFYISCGNAASSGGGCTIQTGQ